MRTYSGHSTAQASNELYRLNLSKGQTGLSVAFDLPTQIGYDSDDPQATTAITPWRAGRLEKSASRFVISAIWKPCSPIFRSAR